MQFLIKYVGIHTKTYPFSTKQLLGSSENIPLFLLQAALACQPQTTPFPCVCVMGTQIWGESATQDTEDATPGL